MTQSDSQTADSMSNKKNMESNNSPYAADSANITAITSTQPQSLDMVIAWVDGNDPALKAKRQQYQDKTQPSDAISATRFASDNEIYFNIASILKYVPFCRHIYVVSDNQSPQWINEFTQQNLCPPDKIRLVDHSEIFRGYESYLPTFNTRSIESMLWNIDGLSDFFVYLNDDFFFNSQANLADFVMPSPDAAQSPHIVTYGHWSSTLPLKTKLKYRQFLQQRFGKPIQPKHMIAQMLGADILGLQRFFEIHHYPHVVDRRILKDYLQAHPKRLQQQIQYKFRSVEQVNPISLMNHLKIQQNQAVLNDDLDIAYLKDEQHVSSFLDELLDDRIKYGCIQSLDKMGATVQNQINNAFVSKLGDFLPNSLIEEITNSHNQK